MRALPRRSHDRALEIIGKGKTKVAYALDERVVLKVGPPDRIAKQARRLRRLERHGIPVARVILSGDGWLIQERCELLDVRDEVTDHLGDVALARGFFVHDLHRRNIGWLRGQWVILDCGALGRRRTKRGLAPVQA